MRKLHAALLLMLLTVGMQIIPYTAEARSYKNKKFALISYSFSIHPDVRGKIIPFEGLFPMPPPNFSHIDPVYFRLKGMCFDMIKMKLEREKSMFIMPLLTYARRFNYDSEGYPSMLIEVAQRKGDARFYMGIDFRLLTSPESAVGVSGEKYRDSVLSPKDYLRPKIEITLTLYPRLGIVPCDRFSTTVQWMTPIRLEPTMLDGIVNSKRRHDRSSLLEALELAVESLIENM